MADLPYTLTTKIVRKRSLFRPALYEATLTYQEVRPGDYVYSCTIRKPSSLFGRIGGGPVAWSRERAAAKAVALYDERVRSANERDELAATEVRHG